MTKAKQFGNEAFWKLGHKERFYSLLGACCKKTEPLDRKTMKRLDNHRDEILEDIEDEEQCNREKIIEERKKLGVSYENLI
jgi:hypothetical protein